MILQQRKKERKKESHTPEHFPSCYNCRSFSVQCSAVQCSALQFSAVQCSAVQCSSVQCSAIQCTVLRFENLLGGENDLSSLGAVGASGRKIIVTRKKLLRSPVNCPALYCTAVHCTALHCTALHCTAAYIECQHGCPQRAQHDPRASMLPRPACSPGRQDDREGRRVGTYQ
jgi:hypothetical protein